ncbi:MAG: hypothetical protein QF632_06765 [Candidatus Woesearchaeota archaeon]|jgi:hypothetical protein|nr:hypothetical protein [Candidatus Woesearchaeota archaeon]MDP7324437.1 hypothetical protein [Candidatus Woesearchaeota archaeon]MDP7457722.1 hypothetical protein [Candidatus Woesearchaeota archaeon]
MVKKILSHIKKVKWKNEKHQFRSILAVTLVLAVLVVALDSADYGVTGHASQVFSILVESCTDSDGGRDLMEAGYANIFNRAGASRDYSDHCKDTRLNEYSCDGDKLLKTAYSCRAEFGDAYHCRQGRCCLRGSC